MGKIGIKTLLINPPPPKVVELEDAPSHPHIGLGYLASYLRSKNCAVEVLDAKLERLNVSDTLERISSIKPDIIGLTAYTQEIIHVANLAKKIKKRYPSIHTVIGGIHATVLPSQTLKEFSSFDFLVFGEGEVTLYELVDALKYDRPLDKIKGLGFRKEGKIYINQSREWNSELDNLPFPAWDLFPQAKHYPILTSRGCPFQCIFCTRPYGNKVRMRSPKNVVAEFRKVVRKYKPKEIMFCDETFGVDKKRAMTIANMLIEENLAGCIKWAMHSRVDVVDYELLKRLKKAGCFHVGFGVESGNPKILKMGKKGITLEQVRKAVKMAKKLGLKTESYFILGFPYETKKTAWDTINFARKLNTDTTAIAIMIPFPKTEIAGMVERGEGGYKQISYNWSDYNKQSGAVVELEGLSRRALCFFQLLGYFLCYVGNLHFVQFAKMIRPRFKQVLILAYNLFRRD